MQGRNELDRKERKRREEKRRKEGRREGGKEGGREGGKEGRKEGRKGGKKGREGWKEGEREEGIMVKLKGIFYSKLFSLFLKFTFILHAYIQQISMSSLRNASLRVYLFV